MQLQRDCAVCKILQPFGSSLRGACNPALSCTTSRAGKTNAGEISTACIESCRYLEGLFEKIADPVKALLGLRGSVPHLQFCRAGVLALVKT